MNEIRIGDTIHFRYTNYQMETERRRARVKYFWYGSSRYHQGEQWFVNAFCLDREDYRDFAMRDMTEVTNA